MVDVHVDQSHCNYHLRVVLEAHGWAVRFRDSPASSRGGRGSQGAILAIVESRGWPIPDVLLTRDAVLFVIEIDSTLSAALPSFRRYREVERELLEACSAQAERDLETLQLGFCRSVVTPHPERYFDAEAATAATNGIDVLMAFPEPRQPVARPPLD